MILTVDNGQSITKVAVVDNQDNINVVVSETIRPEGIQDKLVTWCKELGSKGLAVATTWAITKTARQASFPVEGNSITYSDLDKILEQTTINTAALYNDAEATAHSLNLPQEEIHIQEGSLNPRKKTLVYLGTGFQLVRTHYDSSRKLFVPEYGGGLRASPPLSLFTSVKPDLLARIAAESAVENIGKLRYTHILSARGLGNIHAALSGERKSVQEILENPAAAEETFLVYSRLLGKCLHNFASTDGFSQGIYLGGSFAPALEPHLNYDAVRETFNLPGDLTEEAYRSIPISLVKERYSANKGLAFAVKKGIPTTSNVY